MLIGFSDPEPPEWRHLIKKRRQYGKIEGYSKNRKEKAPENPKRKETGKTGKEQEQRLI
jgi:hypothetical protein